MGTLLLTAHGDIIKNAQQGYLTAGCATPTLVDGEFPFFVAYF